MQPLRLVSQNTRTLLFAAVLFGGLAATAVAQGDTATSARTQAVSGRAGLFRAGGWYFTPYLNIGTLGVDSNVFYTPTDAQTDFTFSGGPGLDVIRPFAGSHRLRIDGGLDYLWFARTEAQRRLNWYGASELELDGVKTSLVLSGGYAGTFSRPSFDVDKRVQRDTITATARIVRRLGDRWQAAGWGAFRDTETEDSLYLGTDLGDTLTERRYDAGGELRRALTIKTQLVAGGEHSWHAFPRLSERNGRTSLAYGGFRTRADALISGEAMGGYRWFWSDAGSWDGRGLWYANVNATLNITRRTAFGATFFHDLEYSALNTITGAPTLANERLRVFLDKLLTSSIYVRLFGRRIRYTTEELAIQPAGVEMIIGARNDRVHEAGVELGYQFRARVRVGISAVYTERQSNVETFGVEGLLAGLTVTYDPPTPLVR